MNPLWERSVWNINEWKFFTMAKYIDVAAVSGMVLERQEEGPREALNQFLEAAERLEGTGVDLVVTCETMMMNQAAGTGEDPAHPGEILEAFRTFARENHCTVVGASRTLCPEPRQSLVYYGPDGEQLGIYHKMFPTPEAIKAGTVPGEGAVVVDTPAGKLGGILCYDLNFDELRDQYIALKPQILCFSSYYHGGTAMVNWAFRTGAFMVGAIKDIGSEIYDPLGRRLNATTYYHRIARARINIDYFFCHGGSGNAEKYPEIMRKYGKKVLIDHDSPSACGIIYSCTDEFTAQDLAKEFELVPLCETLQYSREVRAKALKIN